MMTQTSNLSLNCHYRILWTRWPWPGHWNSRSPSLLHSVVFLVLKLTCFTFFTMFKARRVKLQNIWKLCTYLNNTILWCGKNYPYSILFYAGLMCALLFSLDKCNNYQRTKLQNKINCSILCLSQIQQLFRFSFHLLEPFEITYWNFLALFDKPNEEV